MFYFQHYLQFHSLRRFARSIVGESKRAALRDSYGLHIHGICMVTACLVLVCLVMACIAMAPSEIRSAPPRRASTDMCAGMRTDHTLGTCCVPTGKLSTVAVGSEP